NRDFARPFQSVRAHHPDVHPGDRENTRAAERRGGDVADPSAAVTMVWSIASWRPLAVFTFAKNDFARFRIENEFSRQKRRKMFGNTDWSHAGPAAAVRNTKGLMQIQMANVRAIITGAAKTDLGIHVRAIHVDLTAVRLHDVTNFASGYFENAVRGGIGHHQRGEIACVLVGFGAQIGKIDISIFQ